MQQQSRQQLAALAQPQGQFSHGYRSPKIEVRSVGNGMLNDPESTPASATAAVSRIAERRR